MKHTLFLTLLGTLLIIASRRMKKSLRLIPVVLIFLMSLSACDDDDINDASSNNAVSEGYVLFTFIRDDVTHLIDNDGNDVKTWTSSFSASGACYLSADKNLLRTGITTGAENGTFGSGGGVAGIIEELDDESNVIWSFQKDDDDYTLHHDFKEIDSNTIIALAWNLAEYNGRNYWNEKVIMIDKTTNSILWEWSAIDDGNLLPTGSGNHDYLHFNSVDYKEGEILVSARSTSTLYLINEESKSIVTSYTCGGRFSGQHDASFLANGNIIVFNNSDANDLSSVIEINTDDEVVWEYFNDFYSSHISGVQRLESGGNTLICSGVEPRFIEVSAGEEVWEYSPVNSNANSQDVFKIRKYTTF